MKPRTTLDFAVLLDALSAESLAGADLRRLYGIVVARALLSNVNVVQWLLMHELHA